MQDTRQSLYIASMLSSQLGADHFADVLSKVPDQFFKLNDNQQASAWRSVRNAVLQGERRTEILAHIAGRECK